MNRNIFLTIALSVAAAATAAPPQKLEVTYQLQRNDLTLAEVTQKLEHDGKAYKLQENTKGKGAFSLRGEATRTSTGAVAADGLRPKSFEDKRSGRDPKKVEFDPASKAPTLEQQDRLSFIWSFAFAPPKGPVTVKVKDGEGGPTYHYQPSGREKLKTPAGEFDTLKLVKRRDNPGDRVTEIWLAVDRGYIPVRVLLVEKDGTRIDQVAAKVISQ
jgi:hypothetical protein